MQTQKTMMQKLLQFEDFGISACFIKWVNMGKTWNKSDEINKHLNSWSWIRSKSYKNVLVKRCKLL